MKTYDEIIESIKVFTFIIMLFAPIAACEYWLATDDKRMYNEYMSECAAKKQHTPQECWDKYVIAYRNTLGRNPR